MSQDLAAQMGIREGTHVLLAFPYDRNLTGPFVQSLDRTRDIPGLRVSHYHAPGSVIHLSRDAMIRRALADTTITHLCMVDTDQTFDSLVLPRLVHWNVPVVAPFIVQRNGPPIPVAYKELGQDAQGQYRHEPFTQEIVAYVSQFDERWWSNDSGTAVLPLAPDYPPRIDAIPPAVLAGLKDPLLPVDAVGAGMVVLRRDVLEALNPAFECGLYCSFEHGGEDFSLMRNVRAAGWGGVSTPGPRGHGVYLDRGCLVGHLRYYARGMGDFLNFMEAEAEKAAQQDADLPHVSELAAKLRGQTLQPQPAWMATRLPGEAVAA